MSDLQVKKANIRYWDWLSAVLLIIIMQIAAARLAATLWTKHLELVEILTFLGSVLGLALGYSKFNRFWAGVIAAVYGIVLVPWQLGLTLEHKFSWNDRLVILWERLQLVIRELITRQPITDNLLFLLLMA